MTWKPRKLLYKRKQAMEALGVGSTTLYRLMTKGIDVVDKDGRPVHLKLRARKLGKSLMIEGESLEELAEALPEAKLKPPKSADHQGEETNTAV